jgi:hypothetical protein
LVAANDADHPPLGVVFGKKEVAQGVVDGVVVDAEGEGVHDGRVAAVAPPVLEVSVDARVAGVVPRVGIAALVALHELCRRVQDGSVRAKGHADEAGEDGAAGLAHVLLRGVGELTAEETGVLGQDRAQWLFQVRVRKVDPLDDDVLERTLLLEVSAQGTDGLDLGDFVGAAVVHGEKEGSSGREKAGTPSSGRRSRYGGFPSFRSGGTFAV